MLAVQEISFTHLKEAAGWARFLAIMGFVGSALLALAGTSMLFFRARVYSYGADHAEINRAYYKGAGSLNLLALIYFAGAVLYFFRCLLLYRFADRLKYSLDVSSQDDLALAFNNLKKMFRYTGILTIVVVALYLILFFGAMIAALNR